MEKIDWDKAPEGATHFTPAGDADGTNAVFWRVIEGSVVNAWAVFKSGDLKEISINRLLDLSRPDILTRPSPSWSGKGLPPVGVVCEARAFSRSFKDGEWIKCKIAFVDDLGAFIHSDELIGCSCIGLSHANLEFRPIRTPEQIAADEWEAAINDLESLICAYASHRDAAIHIYDVEGYRKP